MNKYAKEFFKRGFIYGGLGPIIGGLIYLIISLVAEEFALTGVQVFVMILSTYILAFVQAGASVFNQIEDWSTLKSLLVHIPTIYATYVACYLINVWIPLDWMVILIFTGIFIAIYLVIYFSVYISLHILEKKLNKSLKKLIK